MGRSPFRVGSILSETLTAEPTRAVALHVCRHGLQIRRWQGAPAQLPALSANNPLQDCHSYALWPWPGDGMVPLSILTVCLSFDPRCITQPVVVSIASIQYPESTCHFVEAKR